MYHIISGPNRSYSSLTMQILNALGLPVVGTRDHNIPNIPEIENKNMFEFEGMATEGLKKDIFDEHIIKILLHGLTNTNPSILANSKTIMCMRPPIEVAYSADEIGGREFTPLWPYQEWMRFLLWLKDNPWFIDNIILLNTNNYFKSPETAIQSLSELFGVSPSVPVLESCVKLIRPKKQRDLKWSEQHMEMGIFVDKLFDCVCLGDYDRAINLAFRRLYD